MEYAIEQLKKERVLLEKALSNWSEDAYPEAKKVRDQRLKEINQAIEKLEQ